MIAPNSVVRKKEGEQEEEEDAGRRRKAGSTGTPTPDVDASISPPWSGVSDVRNMRKHGL